MYITNNITVYPEETVDIATIKETCKDTDLVTSNREKVDVKFANIHGNLANGLGRVRVKKDSSSCFTSVKLR